MGSIGKLCIDGGLPLGLGCSLWVIPRPVLIKRVSCPLKTGQERNAPTDDQGPGDQLVQHPTQSPVARSGFLVIDMHVE